MFFGGLYLREKSSGVIFFFSLLSFSLASYPAVVVDIPDANPDVVGRSVSQSAVEAAASQHES